MIDKQQPGGECTWSGCIPSKAFIHQANEIYNAKRYASVNVDTQQIMAHVRHLINKVYDAESEEVLATHGIEFIKGSARFVYKSTVDVDGVLIKAKRIFICTGSSPLIPHIDGLENSMYLTNQTFFQQVNLPSSIVVLGAGAIGMELSQAMNRLGVRVDVIEMADTILPKEDPQLTQLLYQRCTSEGLTIHTKS